MRAATAPTSLPWEQKRALPARSQLGVLERSDCPLAPAERFPASDPWDLGLISEPLEGRQASWQASVLAYGRPAWPWPEGR